MQWSRQGDVAYLPACSVEGPALMTGAEPFAYYGTERSKSATSAGSPALTPPLRHQAYETRRTRFRMSPSQLYWRRLLFFAAAFCRAYP